MACDFLFYIEGGSLRIIPDDPSTEVRPAHSRPWNVGLIFSIDYRIKCGGTLIGHLQQHVITAAHCLGSGAPLYVVVGEHIQGQDNNQEYVKIKGKPVIHPSYNTNDDYDLAILVLAKRVTNKNAHFLELPQPNYIINRGWKLTFLDVDGWGMTGPNIDETYPSDILRTVTLHLLNKEQAKMKGMCLNDDLGILMCGENLADPVKGPCSGDSGGKLQYQLSVTYVALLFNI